MWLRDLLLHVVQSPGNSPPTRAVSWDVHWCGWHCFFTGGSIISWTWKFKLDYIICLGCRGEELCPLKDDVLLSKRGIFL